MNLAIGGQRVYWEGPLFGRLSKSGKHFLEREFGWQRLNDNPPGIDPEQLALVWPNKSGPQFDGIMKSEVDYDSDKTDCRSIGPFIRPFPNSLTHVVDDKIQLAKLLEETDLAPQCFSSSHFSNQGNYTCKIIAKDLQNKNFFVKHRFGVQGKSVYYKSYEQVQEWLTTSNKGNAHDFVIQQEIPPMLFDGKKFVLRSHLLLIQRQPPRHDSHRQQRLDDSMTPQNSLIWEAFAHKEAIICQAHAISYDKSRQTNNKAAHVSHAAKKSALPPPVLLKDLPQSHPAANSWLLVYEISQKLVSRIRMDATTRELCEASHRLSENCSAFALMGLDLMMNSDGQMQIVEVNSHPALGWGTMAAVPGQIYDNLVCETLALLIAGRKSQTSFVPLDSKKLAIDAYKVLI